MHQSWSEHCIPFGKYKGMTYEYINKVDKGYLQWIKASPAMPELYVKISTAVLNGEDITPIVPPNKTKFAFVKKQNTPGAVVWLKTKKTAYISFDYDPNIVAMLKYEIDGRKWNKTLKCWEIPVAQLVNLHKVFGDNIKWEDDVKKLYDKEIERQKDLKELSTQTDIPLDIKTLIPLHGYQKVAIQFADKAGGRIVIADQPGLGKTATSIGFAEFTKSKTLIICPKSVVPGWIREISKFSGKKVCHWDTNEVNGHRNSQYHIIHYDAVVKYIDQLVNCKFDLLVCDEATLLKNRKTKRASAIFGHKGSRKNPGIRTKYCLLLTATPVLNRPVELFTLLNFLDSQRYVNFMHFTEKYGGWRGSETKNLDELHERIQELVIRRTREEVADDLPEKQRYNIYIDLSKTERKQYEQLLKDVFTKWKASSKPGLAEMHTLQQFLGTLKMTRVMELINEYLDNDKSILIYSNYLKPLEQICKIYPNDTAMFHGQLNINERKQVIDDLSTGRKKIGLATMGAGAVGIDGLQYAIDTVVFLDQAWVPSMHEQAEGRVFRQNQKSNKVQVYYLLAENTTDEYMRTILEEKQKVIDEIMDGQQVMLNVNKSIFAEFVQLLRKNFQEEF